MHKKGVHQAAHHKDSLGSNLKPVVMPFICLVINITCLLIQINPTVLFPFPVVFWPLRPEEELYLTANATFLFFKD